MRYVGRLLTQRISIFRSPEPVNGRVGGPVEVATKQPARIVPAGSELNPAPSGLAGGRGDHVGLFRDTTGIQEGDEVRLDADRFKVEGVARWEGLNLCDLSKLQQATP